jgi:chromatin remodeling complex protein RSC6
MAGKTSSKKEDTEKSKPRGGLATPVKPDAKLAAVVGKDPLPRSQLTKKIWDYVKSNNLQDEKNRRMINADDKLRPVFNGQDQVSMFEMTKLVNQHVSK